MHAMVPERLPPEAPVLIAGPTASGKSALALAIAEAQGGVIVNADALQVYDLWHILTARPGPADIARAPHALYGHVAAETPYSVGHWLREVAPLLAWPARPIVVGGTGLFFRALTEGLAAIPPVPAAVRAEAAARLEARGLAALVAELDAETAAAVDRANPARVLRAWEVLRATGRGLAAWHEDTGPPLLAPDRAVRLLLNPPPAVLLGRIEARLDAMLDAGVLDEVRAALPRYDPARPSGRAIGAAEFAAHLRGEMSLAEARAAAIVATRQYAKRQRTWFRARMADWQQIAADT